MKEAIFYIVIMGVQLFLVKLVSKHLTWQTTILCVWCVAFVIIFFSVIFSKQIEFNAWSLVGVGAGILAAVGTIIMYNFIRNNDLGMFTPILSIVPVIGVILSMIFLGEPITKNKVIAIALSCVIPFLLYEK